MHEKISNKLLAVPICIIYLFIALFIFFVVGLSKVEAETVDITAIWANGTGLGSKPGTVLFDGMYQKSIWVDFYVSPGSGQSHVQFIFDFVNSPIGPWKNIPLIFDYYLNDVYYECNSKNTCYVDPVPVISDGSGTYNVYVDFIVTQDTKITIHAYFNQTSFDGYFNGTISGSTSYTLATENINSGTVNSQTNSIINNNNANTELIIDNQNSNQEQTNEKLDDLNDTLSDSDTTGANNTAGGFFDSFNNEDNGGISGIITAPLVAINEMLSQTCVDLTGSYKGKEFSIPSGCDFWSRIPDVKNFLNVIEGGLLCYLIIRKMFYLVQRLKNPEDDRVEVMSL